MSAFGINSAIDASGSNPLRHSMSDTINNNPNEVRSVLDVVRMLCIVPPLR